MIHLDTTIGIPYETGRDYVVWSPLSQQVDSNFSAFGILSQEPGQLFQRYEVRIGKRLVYGRGYSLSKAGRSCCEVVGIGSYQVSQQVKLDACNGG